jgi:hypothetical protein
MKPGFCVTELRRLEIGGSQGKEGTSESHPGRSVTELFLHSVPLVDTAGIRFLQRIRLTPTAPAAGMNISQSKVGAVVGCWGL